MCQHEDSLIRAILLAGWNHFGWESYNFQEAGRIKKIFRECKSSFIGNLAQGLVGKFLNFCQCKPGICSKIIKMRQ